MRVLESSSLGSIVKIDQIVLDEMDTIADDVDVSINLEDIIFMDVYIYFKSADSLVENGVGDHLFLLQNDQICPQFDSDEIDIDDGPEEGENDDSDEEGNYESEGNIDRFSYQNKVVHVSFDNKEA